MIDRRDTLSAMSSPADDEDHPTEVELFPDDELPAAVETPAPITPIPIAPVPVEPILGYHLPRNRVARPKFTEVLVVIAWMLAGISCAGPGLIELIFGPGETTHWSLIFIIAGGLAFRFGYATWRDSRTRRFARAHVPRYCDRCKTALTGLAVSNCPNCGQPHRDSAAAAAERLGRFVDPDHQ